MDPELRLYDAKEIAKMLGLHLRTVQLLFRRGTLRGMKVGRAWKATQEDIEAYLEAQRQAALEATRRRGE
jgi:excisionase family DNA binding protein